MDYNESPLYSPPKPEDYMAIGLGLIAFLLIAFLIVLTGFLVFALLI